jgi:Domain of unknown function (DUF4395)
MLDMNWMRDRMNDVNTGNSGRAPDPGATENERPATMAQTRNSGSRDITGTSDKARARIVAQGVVKVEDQELGKINYWLRLSPAICMLWTAVGAVLGSPAVIFALVPFAFLGGLLPNHPFDALYNFGFRHLFGAPVLPRSNGPRRFGFFMGATMLLVVGWGFQSGHQIVGYGIAWLLVGLAFVNVSTGFFLPSFIHGIISGKRFVKARQAACA